MPSRALMMYIYRNTHPEIVEELLEQNRVRRRVPKKERKSISITDAAVEIEIYTRIPAYVARQKALEEVRRYVINRFLKDSHRDTHKQLFRWIFQQDCKLGVWCALQVAREALPNIPPGELRPLRAIEAAEGWVQGIVPIKDVRKAASRVADADNEEIRLRNIRLPMSRTREKYDEMYYESIGIEYAMKSVYEAVMSASSCEDDGRLSDWPAQAAISALYYTVNRDTQAEQAGQDRLLHVIADAIPGLP